MGQHCANIGWTSRVCCGITKVQQQQRQSPQQQLYVDLMLGQSCRRWASNNLQESMQLYSRSSGLRNNKVSPSKHYTSIQCWANVVDGLPALVQHWIDGQTAVNPYNAIIFLFKPWRRNVFFQFQIILFSSFRFIWIPVLWVCAHYNYLTLSVRRSTLDVRIWRL